VADRLAESEDVDMASADRSGQCGDGYDVTTIDELSAKFSVQGTSSSKSSGKKKVVCISNIQFKQRGARWRSWLRHCATSQKVTGLIPDGVIGFFHLHNPSGCNMALGSTQPLTEMSTRNVSWG